MWGQVLMTSSRPLLATLAAIMICCLCGLAETGTTLSGDRLEVALDTGTASLTICDRRNGSVWRQMALAPRQRVVAPRLRPVKGAAGRRQAWVSIPLTKGRDEKLPTLRLAHDGTCLHLYGEIDDSERFFSRGNRKWFECDALLLALGESQVALVLRDEPRGNTAHLSVR